jgi:hypothetical protein
VRAVLIVSILLISVAPAAGQVGARPPGLATVEAERSRACVDVLARVDAVDARLAPLAARTQRLLAIAQAVALEDRAVMDSLDTTDAVESQVRAWFVTDGALAERWVAEQDPALQEERTAGREAIKAVVSEAVRVVQDEANGVIRASGDLSDRAAPCDGAIFLRGAVLEACATSGGPICEEAGADPSDASRFRFVDSAESLWEVEVLQPWTEPTALRPDPDGQLGGARTVGFTRVGNVAISVAFSPLLRSVTDVTPNELATYISVGDSLGLHFDHPDFAFAPALGVRATLPTALAGETSYVLHFGDAESADVLWTAPAGTGRPLEGSIPLGAGHVGRLSAGDAITLTAMREGPEGADEPVFAIRLTSVSQASATRALMGYMARQLSADLRRLVPPSGSGP